MNLPEIGSVEVETSLDFIHGANRSKVTFQICSCDKYISIFFHLSG